MSNIKYKTNGGRFLALPHVFVGDTEPSAEAPGDLWLASPNTSGITWEGGEFDRSASGIWYPDFEINQEALIHEIIVRFKESQTVLEWFDPDIADASDFEIRFYDYDDGLGGSLTDENVWREVGNGLGWTGDPIDLSGEVTLTVMVEVRRVGEIYGVAESLTITYNESTA